MFTRTSSLFVASLLLCGCNLDHKPDNSKVAEAEQKAAQAAEEDGRILCALDGTTKFERSCRMDRVAGQEGEVLVLSRPDGGFRRFRVMTDGTGVQPADGAEPAKLSLVDKGVLQIGIANDLYRLPAATADRDARDQATGVQAGTGQGAGSATK